MIILSSNRSFAQYLGSQTSEEVKDKCIEILYNWTKELRHESKIQEAYDMLKTQGIVKSDPLTHEQVCK